MLKSLALTSIGFVGVGAAAFGLAIRDTRRLGSLEIPATLRRVAAQTWGVDNKNEGATSYFDTFAAPSYTIVNDNTPGCGGVRQSLSESVRAGDGADLARAFFTSAAFWPEKVGPQPQPQP
jgi:hypothetical protein